MSKSAEEWAREALMTFREGGLVDHFAATIRAAVEEEREACARAVESQGFYRDEGGEKAAALIRSRSTTGGEGE